MTESDIGTDSPFSLEAVANTLGWETVCGCGCVHVRVHVRVCGCGLWVGMCLYMLRFCHSCILNQVID